MKFDYEDDIDIILAKVLEYTVKKKEIYKSILQRKFYVGYARVEKNKPMK